MADKDRVEENNNEHLRSDIVQRLLQKTAPSCGCAGPGCDEKTHRRSDSQTKDQNFFFLRGRDSKNKPMLTLTIFFMLSGFGQNLSLA